MFISFREINNYLKHTPFLPVELIKQSLAALIKAFSKPDP